MTSIPDVEAMRGILRGWADEHLDSGRPTGRWAMERAETGEVIGGGAVLALPPEGEDLEIGWQLAREVWGQGYAAEAGHALARSAFSHGGEVFAVVRPRTPAASPPPAGSGWSGSARPTSTTTSRLQVFRMRKGDIDIPSPRAGQ